MSDQEYFSHLYEIARYLNKEFSLHSALRKALEKTVELLHLETGWIWMMQEPNNSVYLAASYNLPPALSDFPERLSGRCYCIDKYLANGISKATNISEITCSRLTNIKTGTRDLKFHATIPITIKNEKVGLINLVSKETQQLDEKQLSILNTISELISIAIQRTRMQSVHADKNSDENKVLRNVISRSIEPRTRDLANQLSDIENMAKPSAIEMKKLVRQAEDLHQQISLISQETETQPINSQQPVKSCQYPTSPLTNRELDVLVLVKKGLTNKQIGEQLFIAERTVKFHMSAILSKLLAHTRTEAVEIALSRGLLG